MYHAEGAVQGKNLGVSSENCIPQFSFKVICK